MIKTDYTIVESDSDVALERTVCNMLENGFRLQGGVSVCVIRADDGARDYLYSQAMTRKFVRVFGKVVPIK